MLTPYPTNGGGGGVPHISKYWHPLAHDRIQCDVCPRHCKLKDGQAGFCLVRGREGPGMVLRTFGRAMGLCVDPIEKKPLYHFLPGTPVLSFGTAGCNLSCRFCQNWTMTRSKAIDQAASAANPEAIALKAASLGCRSVAYTYNDPVIFLEYAVATAKACRELGIYNVAVTAGYVQPEARADLFAVMDAANVDLKSFDDKFYHRLCNGHLQPVLDTLLYLHQATSVWLEITTLLLPGINDSPQEITAMSQWLMKHLGPDVPWHFSAFHPDFRMLDTPRTPHSSLQNARKIAMHNGLRYVYTGNVYDRLGGSTWCYNCGLLLIERNWHQLGTWGLDANGHCRRCHTPLPGVIEGYPGTWGSQRLPVSVATAT